MKKLAAFVMALCLISSQAFAVTYTVTSTEKYRDVNGDNQIRVKGTIAFDSAYPCNTTTGQCGENIEATNLGMETIDQMVIDPSFSTVAAGLLLFKYHATGLRAKAGSQTDGPNIRAYYSTQGVSGVTGSAFVSAPSYNLALLTAVPFVAYGS